MTALDPDDLARGEFSVTSASFAVGKRVLDEVIANHNGWVAFGVHASRASGVTVPAHGRPIHMADLAYYGTRDRATRHFYGLEDSAGLEIGLMVIDEADIAEVEAIAYDTWSFWSVWFTLTGGMKFAIGGIDDVG